MSRLIDADAFVQMMEEKCDPESTLDPWVLSVCRGGVKMMPTVDAVPVRHGRWVGSDSQCGIACSVCGVSVDDFCCSVDYIEMNYQPNFCPNCGADMRKDCDDGKAD